MKWGEGSKCLNLQRKSRLRNLAYRVYAVDIYWIYEYKARELLRKKACFPPMDRKRCSLYLHIFFLVCLFLETRPLRPSVLVSQMLRFQACDNKLRSTWHWGTSCCVQTTEGMAGLPRAREGKGVHRASRKEGSPDTPQHWLWEACLGSDLQEWSAKSPSSNATG